MVEKAGKTGTERACGCVVVRETPYGKTFVMWHFGLRDLMSRAQWHSHLMVRAMPWVGGRG